MKPTIVILSLLIATCGFSQTGRLQPNTETSFDLFSGRSRVIQPGLLVYGVPWTATIEEFKKAFGPPTGVFAIRSDAVALIYGRSHVLLFEKGELREVSIDTRLFSYVLDPHILPHPFFDARDLVIGPGIKLGMTPEEIQELIPGRFAVPNIREYTASCVLEHASLQFWFSLRRAPEGEPDMRNLMSITIRGL